MKLKILLMCFIFQGLYVLPLYSETSVSSKFNWSSGLFEITISRDLEKGLSPSDHPEAFIALKEDMPGYTVKELGKLQWDRNNSIQSLADKNPYYRKVIEEIALALNLEWSRLSVDHKKIEVKYNGNLKELIPEFFPEKTSGDPPERPLEWVSEPQDGWSGIVIYVPDDLPVKGTNAKTSAIPAINARIINKDMEVLFDPAIKHNWLAYYGLNDTEGIDRTAGGRPIQIMARELYGIFPCDIVISSEDSKRILASDSGIKALATGKVAVIFDKLP